MKRYSSLLVLLPVSLSVLFACKKTDDTPAVQPVQSQTVRNLPADPTTPSSTTGQPATGTTKFTFYSLRDNKIVSNSDSATRNWDIGFQALRIIVNGGAIRTGQGAAYVHTGTFDELTSVPTSATFAQDQSASALAITARSGSGWYNYSSTTNVVSPIPGRVLVIRTADGKYAKVEILSYYQNAPAQPTSADVARYYTFRYVYQPDGSTKLN